MSTVSASTNVDLVRATREQLDELDDLLERMLGLPVKPETNSPEPQRPERQEPPREVPPPPAPAHETLPEPGSVATEDRPAQREEQADDSWVPLRSTWQPSPQTWGPLARTWRKLAAKEDLDEGEDLPLLQTRQTPPQTADRLVEEPPRVELPKAAPPEDEQPAFTPHRPLYPALDSTIGQDHSWQAGKDDPANAGDTVKQTLADALARLRKAEPPAAPPQPRAPLWVWPLLAIDKGYEWATLPLGPVGRWLRGGAGRELMAWLGVLAFLAAATLMALDGLGWTW